MGIQSVHPDYPEYKKCYDFVEIFYEGEKAIMKNRAKLVPRLADQTDDEYEAYVSRAMVPAVVSRTVSALISTAFRSPPALILPEKLKYLETDCTGRGTTFNVFAMQMLKELLVGGRVGVLVDILEDGGNPRFVMFDGDDILNYSEESDNTYIVLENETLVRDPEDKYNLIDKEGYRELTLENGEYRVNLWEAESPKDGANYYITQTFQPLKSGKPLSYIPFVGVSPYDLSLDVSDPPMLALANICQKHLLAACDYGQALHVACSPTVFVYSDIDAKDFGKFKLGPSACHILPAGSKAEWLEFTGQGIEPLQLALDRFENMMAALGARLVMGQNASSEKAAGVNARSETSNSVLTSVLISLESALNALLKIVADWEGIPTEEVYCKVNKELLVSTMDANMVNALVQAYLNNAIDFDTLWFNLTEGGFISAESDKETFAANLKKQESEKNEKESSDKPQIPLDNEEEL